MTRPRSGENKTMRMMHLRTLDWGMDELRDLIVVLEFVRSKGEDPDKVIGRCITYAGFTGILTGVRWVYSNLILPYISKSLKIINSIGT